MYVYNVIHILSVRGKLQPFSQHRPCFVMLFFCCNKRNGCSVLLSGWLHVCFPVTFMRMNTTMILNSEVNYACVFFLSSVVYQLLTNLPAFTADLPAFEAGKLLFCLFYTFNLYVGSNGNLTPVGAAGEVHLI